MAWYDEVIPPDVTVERSGQQVPFKELPFVKDTPDLPTFLKRSFEAHSEVDRLRGSSVPLPKNGDLDGWKKEHLPKLQSFLKDELRPQAPEKYEINRPESVPEHLWNNEWVDEFSGLAKKYGLSQEAVQELLAFDAKRFSPMKQVSDQERAAAKASVEKWATEKGLTYEQVMEAGGRFLHDSGYSEDEIKFYEHVGLADDPRFLRRIAEAALASGEDTSMIEGGASADQVEALVREAQDISGNPQNPKFNLYHSNDPATREYVDNLWKKAYGEKPVNPNEMLNKQGPGNA